MCLTDTLKSTPLLPQAGGSIPKILLIGRATRPGMPTNILTS